MQLKKSMKTMKTLILHLDFYIKFSHIFLPIFRKTEMLCPLSINITQFSEVLL